MTRVPNRRQQRRDYLREKGKAYGGMVMLGMLGLPLCLGIVAFALIAVLILAGVVETNVPGVLIAITAVSMSLATACVCLTRWIWRDLKRIKQSLAALPHIPPVTASTLPVEEILVRGAEEPSAKSETLLRAMLEGDEEAKGELLRSHMP